MTRPPAALSEVLSVLRQRQTEARALGVELVGVVGSVARGDARADSDVDIIVRHSGAASLFALMRFEARLKADLGRPVDLVFSEGLKPERRMHIERDLALL